MNKPNIIEKLSSWIDTNNLSYERASAMIGISRMQLGRILAGKNKPSRITINKINQTLNNKEK